MDSSTLIEMIQRIKARQLVNDDNGVIKIVMEYFQNQQIIKPNRYEKFDNSEF
jgi:hypothetical protein